MQIASALPVMIVEVKRSPRSPPIQKDSISALSGYLELAADEAEDSAARAFGDNKGNKLQKTVLIAVSGEWWRFKVARRKDYQTVFIVGSDS
jgi:hypothetical protein